MRDVMTKLTVSHSAFICMFAVLTVQSWGQTPDRCTTGWLIEPGESCRWTGDRGVVEVSLFHDRSTEVSVNVDGVTERATHSFFESPPLERNRANSAFRDARVRSRGFDMEIDRFRIDVELKGNTLPSNKLRLRRDSDSLEVTLVPDLNRH